MPAMAQRDSVGGAERAPVGRRWLIHGRVQGVGFRYFTKRLAERASVAGWVRNLPDGGVEVVAHGSEEKLESFEQGLRIGPPGARVESIAGSSIRSSRHTDGFDIVR